MRAGANHDVFPVQKATAWNVARIASINYRGVSNVGIDAVAGELEVNRPPARRAPPGELESENPDAAVSGEDVAGDEVAVAAEQDDPDSPAGPFARGVRGDT